MPTELPDSAKVLRNDVGKRMADALEAIAQGSGGSAKIEEMTQAEYDQLTPAQKADGTLRAISDGQTKIQDIDNVTLTTGDNNKLLGVSVSGSDISVGAVALTANDLTITKIAITDFIQVDSGVSIDGRSAIYKQGKHIWLNIYGSITGTFTPNTAKNIGTVKSGYRTENLITTICGIHNSMWGVSNIGYMFFNNDGSFQVSTAASNMNNFKISLDFCTV